jgi:hypothetical protein
VKLLADESVDAAIVAHLCADGRRKRITDNAILHVGHCVHVDALKDFMRAQSVTFAEA